MRQLIRIPVTGCICWALLILALSPARGAAAPRQEITPEQVKAQLPKFERLALEALQKSGVPGMAISIVSQDQVVYAAGFGVRVARQPESVDRETVFQLASLSKPIAATVVAALVGDGVVRFDDPLIQHDPAFQLFDPWVTREVTIRDMLSHRSGLPGEAGNDLERIGFEREEILRRLRFVRPASSFRTHYAYSNFGFTAGNVVAAKAAGKSWEAVSHDRLYAPLGMNKTSSRHADFVKQSNRAAVHAQIQGRWTELHRDPDPQSPAGGVSSTVSDLAQWMRLLLAKGKFDGKQLIAAEALEAMHEPVMYRGIHPVTNSASFYCLGWNLDYQQDGTMVWSHAGAFSQGARTVVSLQPEQNLGIVVLCNGFPSGLPEAVAAIFFDLMEKGESQRDWLKSWDTLYNSLYGPATIRAAIAKYPPPVRPARSLAPAAYLGIYRNDYLGRVYITQESDSLTIAIGPKRRTYPLAHFDRDLFRYYPFDEAPDLPSAVTFTIGADQKAEYVVIEDLNEAGQGKLMREASSMQPEQ